MRIRSIKPEFWRDAKIASLKSRLAGYFFIALWNIADDEGKFKLDAMELHLQAPIFRTKDILTYIRQLSELGLIVFSECSQWCLITNWNHQKIDRPRLPKVKKEEIRWLAPGHSSKPRERSSNVRRKDRIGARIKEQGSELRSEAPPAEVLADGISSPNSFADEGQKKNKTTSGGRIPEPALSSRTGLLWSAYATAYSARYGVRPPWNDRTAGMLTQIVNRIGEHAPSVAEFYLAHADRYYVAKCHPVSLLLRDVEPLYTQMVSGKTPPMASGYSQTRQHAASENNAELLRKLEAGDL